MHKYWPIVLAVSDLSKDPRRKVGAVIVTSMNDIITSGYNGFPRGVQDTPARLNDNEVKLRLTVHAEQNAISNAARLGVSTLASTMIVNLCPCVHCAKSIIQAGIVHLICPNTPVLEPKSKWAEGGVEALELLEEAGVKLTLLYNTGLPGIIDKRKEYND
jgi:dCMP deaminase